MLFKCDAEAQKATGKAAQGGKRPSLPAKGGKVTYCGVEIADKPQATEGKGHWRVFFPAPASLERRGSSPPLRGAAKRSPLRWRALRSREPRSESLSAMVVSAR